MLFSNRIDRRNLQPARYLPCRYIQPASNLPYNKPATCPTEPCHLPTELCNLLNNKPATCPTEPCNLPTEPLT